MSDTLPKLLQEIHSVETPSELNSKLSNFESRIAAILSVSPDQKNYYINHTGRELYRKLYNFGLTHLISYSYDSGFRPNLPEWTPAYPTETLAWYDASDSSTITASSNIISQVDDKSGNNFNLSILTPSKTGPKTGIETLNGLNVFTWDTVGQVLENNSFSYDQNSNGLYFAIIFKCIIDGTQDFVLAGTELNTPGNRMAVRRNGNVNSVQIIGGSGTGANKVLGSSPGSVPEGQDFLIASKFNGSNSHIRINGGLARSGDIGTNTFSSLNIGSNESETSPIKGYIAEVIFFTGSSDEEKTEGYLAHKWDLVPLLPSSHPYKKDPPFIFGV